MPATPTFSVMKPPSGPIDFDPNYDSLMSGMVGLYLFNEGVGPYAFHGLYPDARDAHTLNLVPSLVTWKTGPFGGSCIQTVSNNGNIAFGVGNPKEYEVPLYTAGRSTGKMTLVFWIKTVTTNTGVIVGLYGGASGKGAYLYIFSNAAIQDLNGTGAQQEVIGTKVINDNVWHQVVHVISSSAGLVSKIYVDGVLDTTHTNSANWVNTENALQLRLGWMLGNGNGYVGLIDHLLMWNRELSANEIAGLYANPFCFISAVPKWRRWFLPPPTAVGIAFDAASNSGVQTLNSGVGWNHTWTGSNLYIGVEIEILSAGNTVSSLTYNGVALNFIGGQSTVTSLGRVELWGATAGQLGNLAAGTYQILPTLSGSSTWSGTARSYTNVHQTSPTEGFASNQATNGAGAADATADVVSTADQDWILAACVVNDDAVTAGQTVRNNISFTGVGSGIDEDFGPQSPGTKTMSVTGIAGLKTWAIAGYAIRPVAASNLGFINPLYYILQHIADGNRGM